MESCRILCSPKTAVGFHHHHPPSCHAVLPLRKRHCPLKQVTGLPPLPRRTRKSRLSNATRNLLAPITAGFIPDALQSGFAEVKSTLLEGANVAASQHLVFLSDQMPTSVSPQDAAILAGWLLLATYAVAPPGPLWGLLEYLTTPLHPLSYRSFSGGQIEVGRQLGEGSFGTVFRGVLTCGGREEEVVLKRVRRRVSAAVEMRDVELYMNHRVKRTAGAACADFLGTLEVKEGEAHGKLHEGLWLVWSFQGERTLSHFMKQKGFPANVAPHILPAEGVEAETEEEEEVAVICAIMTELLRCLRDIHRTGLVHRDVKPSNLMVVEEGGGRPLRLIDFGACVDLRSGHNYVPSETVLDPRYAAPENYVLPPNSSPAPLPDPLSSLGSPLVWALWSPDRFDLFSAETFNLELSRAAYDLDRWRKKCHVSDGEFALLDADGGAGWEVAKALLRPRSDSKSSVWLSLGDSRPSAAAALKFRFFSISHKPHCVYAPADTPGEVEEERKVLGKKVKTVKGGRGRKGKEEAKKRVREGELMGEPQMATSVVQFMGALSIRAKLWPAGTTGSPEKVLVPTCVRANEGVPGHGGSDNRIGALALALKTIGLSDTFHEPKQGGSERMEEEGEEEEMVDEEEGEEEEMVDEEEGEEEEGQGGEGARGSRTGLGPIVALGAAIAFAAYGAVSVVGRWAYASYEVGSVSVPTSEGGGGDNFETLALALGIAVLWPLMRGLEKPATSAVHPATSAVQPGTSATLVLSPTSSATSAEASGESSFLFMGSPVEGVTEMIHGMELEGLGGLGGGLEGRRKDGLWEAVDALECQMAALESSISHERVVGAEQKELRARMKTLLTNPVRLP